jgi:hypothetical protein
LCKHIYRTVGKSPHFTHHSLMAPGKQGPAVIGTFTYGRVRFYPLLKYKTSARPNPHVRNIVAATPRGKAATPTLGYMMKMMKMIMKMMMKMMMMKMQFFYDDDDDDDDMYRDILYSV